MTPEVYPPDIRVWVNNEELPQVAPYSSGPGWSRSGNGDVCLEGNIGSSPGDSIDIVYWVATCQ